MAFHPKVLALMQVPKYFSFFVNVRDDDLQGSFDRMERFHTSLEGQGVRQEFQLVCGYILAGDKAHILQ